MHLFRKTPSVDKQLAALQVINSVVLPVGLDLSPLRVDYENLSAENIKGKYGYSVLDKVLLFFVRLNSRKVSLEAIYLFLDSGFIHILKTFN